MSYLIKPTGYKAILNLAQTEMGIKKIKDFFQQNDKLRCYGVQEKRNFLLRKKNNPNRGVPLFCRRSYEEAKKR